MKLGRKVSIAVAVVFAATIVSLILAAFITSRKNIGAMVEAQQVDLAKYNAANIDAWVKSKLSVIDAGGKDLSHYPDQQKGYILNQLKVLASAGNFEKVYTGYETGAYIFSDEFRYPKTYDPRTRPWYTQIKSSGKPGLTEPYISASTGKLIISVMSPLISSGTFRGVLSSNIAFDELTQKVLGIRWGKSGYAFVVDKNGKILIHPKEEYVLKKSLQDLSPDFKDVSSRLGGSGKTMMEYTFGGISKVMSYSQIPSTGWFLCVTVDKSEVYAPVKKQLLSLMTLGGIFLAVGLALVTAFVIRMLKPLASLCDRVADIAEGDGDLTKTIEVGKREDEIGMLAEKLNHFFKHMRGMVGEISQVSTRLATDSEKLSSISSSISTGTEQVASQTTAVATASEEMSSTASDIARNCQMVAESAKVAAATTQSGFSVVSSTLDGIRRRGDLTQDNARAISSLGEKAQEIGAIVGTIEDIADQTNLLALNAAIEAARAGEQGRGFAVVADEVRALAERTTKATKEIGDMIRAVQQQTEAAMVSMEEGVAESAKGMEEAQRIEGALQSILEQVEMVTMQVNQIATAAEQQTAVTTEITGNIQQVTCTLQQTTGESHTVAVTASSLYALAGNLQGVVGRFKL